MTQSPFIIVIPVRYHSTRLPGKPLSLINGKSMLSHVVARCQSSNGKHVVVTTDDERIATHAKQLDVQVIMSSKTCRSGSERIAFSLNEISYDAEDIIVNVQGDEPLISSENINQVAQLLSTSNADVSSLYQSITALSELSNPNTVKVIVDLQERALAFSRSELPYAQNREMLENYFEQGYYKKHIGMYAYRTQFLNRWPDIKQTSLEIVESLEQLSWLQQGIVMQMAKAKSRVAMDVNTQDDLERICQLWDEMAVVQ